MIIINPILFSLTVLLWGCQQQESERTENKFHYFNEKFAIKKLPYYFDEEFLKHNQIEASPIDTQLVSLFIEKDKMLGGGINLYDAYIYYPLFKFYVRESIQGVVVKKQGGAGGVEDLYFLILYTNAGAILSQLILCKQIGDCDRLHVQTGSINKSMQIEINSMIFINGCEGGNYITKSKVNEKFRITNSGKIIK